MAIQINFKLRDRDTEAEFSNRLCTAFAGFQEFVRSEISIADDENTCIMVVGMEDSTSPVIQEVELNRW